MSSLGDITRFEDISALDADVSDFDGIKKKKISKKVRRIIIILLDVISSNFKTFNFSAFKKREKGWIPQKKMEMKIIVNYH